jgi:cation:H+ antiporter
MKEVLFLIGGIIGLLLSAELLIWALSIISNRLKLSRTFIGLTILSIGTSFPEIGTHIMASIDRLRGIEASGIAVGTNIGSNLMQITLILGLTALFTHIYATEKFLKRDYAVMLGSIALVFVLGLNGSISRIEGIILAALYILYLRRLGKLEFFVQKVVDRNHLKKGNSNVKYYFYSAAGLALLLAMAYVVVENAVALSVMYGIEKSFIGAVIIGFGTALPEFTTAIVALRRKMPAMSVGVLVGSNITNPLFALGIGAAISGYSVGKHILFFDLPAWFLVSIAAMIFLVRDKHDRGIRKPEAVVMILLYLTYVLIRMKIAGVIF